MLKFGYEFDRIGVIQEKASASHADGQDNYTWAALYTGVKSKRLNPLRGSEQIDNQQTTNQQKDSWLINKSGRTITPNMRYVVNGINYYIESVRDYRGSRSMIVLDTITKDNDSVNSANTLTSVTLVNNGQVVDGAIVAITGTADQTASFELQGTANGLTLSTTSPTTFSISGTPTATITDLVVVARGTHGGVIAENIEVARGEGSAVLALTLSQEQYDALSLYESNVYYLIQKPWILAEGVWNDDGIWQDDNVWID